MKLSLAQSIAASPVAAESKQDPHWQTQFFVCGMCVLNYTIITHLEEAEKETKWILDSLNLSGEGSFNRSKQMNLYIFRLSLQ